MGHIKPKVDGGLVNPSLNPTDYARTRLDLLFSPSLSIDEQTFKYTTIPQNRSSNTTMEEVDQETTSFTLVTRKPCFDLPTACPNCLPAYIYLKLAQLPFELAFNSTFPDSGFFLLFLRCVVKALCSSVNQCLIRVLGYILLF